MYSFGLVASIIHNGQISYDRADGVVLLPFGAEFAIRLRNKNNKDALAVVTIDGENVSDGGFIVKANSSWDIERAVDKVGKFKFVPADSKTAKAAGKAAGQETNGVINIEWYLRKEYQPIYAKVDCLPLIAIDPSPYFPQWPTPTPYTVRNTGGWVGEGGGGTTSRGMNSTEACWSTGNNKQFVAEGVTVEGSKSSQQFINSSFDKESEIPITMRIVLKGTDKGKFVEDVSNPLYCIECGAKLIRKTARFCSQCGAKV
jgi:hypothetical protein